MRPGQRIYLLKVVVIIMTAFILGSSCGGQQQEEEQGSTPGNEINQQLLEANKHIASVEEESINHYIKRHQWSMQETGTGLRYMIYKQGNGELARNGMVAKISYTIGLINGLLLYSSQEDGAKEFLIGKDEVEAGLHEGILFMRVGDQAKFILPSHLAFGLVGDHKKIPARATLIYDVGLLDLKPKR